MLCFHGDFGWASGGFLGVSTFFTLSGFLITTLLVTEHRRSGSIGWIAFLRRRARRLVPAAIAALGVVVVFGLTVATDDQKRSLFGDLVGAVTMTLNWRFIFSGQAYAQLFAAPSPVQHFWSLAIEGQFYLVFPLIAVVALGRRSSTSRMLAVVAGGMAASLGLTLLAGYSDDRIFYGTDTRAFELLAGAALALLLGRRPIVSTADGSTSVGWAHERLVGAGGAVALAASVVLWSRATLGSDWIYRGGLPAYSLLSVAIVASLVLAPRAGISRLLSTGPLRAVGLLSYGLYLFHWPIFLWLTPERTHLPQWPNFILRLDVTTIVAVVAYVLIEQPIRQRRWRGPRIALPTMAFGSLALLLATSLAITAQTPRPVNDFESARRAIAQPSTVDAPAGLPTVGWFGDSTGLVLAMGSSFDAGGPVRFTNLGGEAELGCSIGEGGRWRLPDDKVIEADPACADQLDRYRTFIADRHPDIAVVLYGPNDLYDREVPGVCADWCHLGDPSYDAWLREQALNIVDALGADGTLVVWLTTPPMPGVGSRVDAFNQMILGLPAARPGRVVTLDFGGHLVSSGSDREDRPDGIHLSDAAAVVEGQGWVVPNVVALWNSR